MPRRLKFYHPYPRFPSVSITGSNCDLKCNHCKGHYLQHMPDVSTPERLKEFCIRHEENGGVGLLISGGSTNDGKVPLEPFLETVKWVKSKTDLIINLHTGMLDREEAEAVAATGVDIVSVDIVGEQDTLRRVYGLDVDIRDYDSTLENLVDGGANVAPHVCIGLDYGAIRGEHKALEMAAVVKPETVVLISLIPTANTPMETVKAPSIETITGIVEEAVNVCKGSEIGLGCMRSRENKHDLEMAAIEAGAKRIAMGSRLTERKVEEEGYEITHLDSCCATPSRYDSRLLRV